MRHLRLFSVLLLSTLAITGCRHRRAHVVPPQQAQAPIVTTLPPIPPLTFPDVQLAKPKPAPPVPEPVVVPAQPKKPQKKRIRRHRTVHKMEPDTTIASQPPAPATAPDNEAAAENGTAALGQLSADDTTANPHQDVQTQQLIRETEDRLKKLSSAQQTAHKDAIAQVASFLAQAKQAFGMNDVVGAQTLANKARILLDEILK